MIKEIKEKVWKTYVKTECGYAFEPTVQRFNVLKKLLYFIKNEQIKGDYFEFGVCKGDTFISAYKLAERTKTKFNMFRAYDSFQGFPEPKGVDKDFERFKEGEAYATIHHFHYNLNKAKVFDDVRIEYGWFNETLTKSHNKELKKQNTKASLVWIDCDMYESTKEVLKFIPPFLQQGTIIVFDDWFCYKGDKNKGEMRACKEFLEANKDISLIEYTKFGQYGIAFIVNKE